MEESFHFPGSTGIQMYVTAKVLVSHFPQHLSNFKTHTHSHHPTDVTEARRKWQSVKHF